MSPAVISLLLRILRSTFAAPCTIKRSVFDAIARTLSRSQTILILDSKVKDGGKSEMLGIDRLRLW
ncbi:uncharacterized protein RSE6_05663 [Rhynchosporium secalis]|uniref:Secreted protein n=1 Tax=Rhynchosporium secalis TaxID=38038 RepID=A0A1E1M8D1_RHYSE|nr:uncharacterized protein RSE6_05663 [Rhynchosporium secalis]